MNQDIVSQLRDFGLEEEVDYSLPTAHFDAGGDAVMSAIKQNLETKKFGNIDYRMLRPVFLTSFKDTGSVNHYYPSAQDQKDFEQGGGKAAFTTFGHGNDLYNFIPEDYVTKGYSQDGKQWLPIDLFKNNNLKDFFAKSEYVDLSNLGSASFFDSNNYGINTDVKPWLESKGMGAKGFLIKAGEKTSTGEDLSSIIKPDQYWDSSQHGNITGLSQKNGKYVYTTDQPNGYVDPIEEKSHWYKPPKKNNLASVVGIGLALFAPGIGGAIGSALTGTAATSIASQVIGSAIVQGAMTEMSGGDFIDGAIRGAVTAGAAPIVSQTIGSSVASAMGDSVFKNLVTNSVTSAATNAVVAGFTGGDISDAALSGALSGAAGSIGQELGVSTEYGTDPFTKQNQMLMSQERGMGLSGDIGRIAGRTGASILMGADPTQAILSGLIRASEVDDLSRPDTPEQEQVRSEETFTFSYPDFSHFGFNNINLDDAGLMGPFGPFENQAPLLLAQETPSFESIFNYPSTQTAGLSDGSNASDLEIIDSLTKEKPTEIGTNVITAPDGSQLVYDQDNNLIDVIAPSDETSELDVDKSLTSDVTAADLNFPSQLEQKEDGTYQLTNDDGSTITIDNAGNIVNVTPEDIVTTPSVVDTTDNKPAEDTVTGGTVVDTVTGGQVNDAVTEQDFNVVAAPDGSQLVFDQDNNLVDIIEPEQAPATEADTDLTSTPGQDFNIITADDGSQLILDQNNNIVNVIDANDSVAKDTEISEIDYGAGTEKPTDFQGPMGPMTEDQVKRYNDEFAKYLDFLQAGEPPPPDYGVQDLGITDENWNSFNQNLLQMQEEGRLPTQWAPNEDGTFTFTSDDGSSITINDSGEITHYTDAPEGNLLTDIVTTTPATSTSGGGASGGGGGGGGGGGTSTKSGSGLNFGSLFSALGGLGALGGAGGVGSRAVSKPAYATDIPEFNATKMFSPTLYAERQKYAKKPPLDENQEKQETRYPW
jgi:hypothetical protein